MNTFEHIYTSKCWYVEAIWHFKRTHPSQSCRKIYPIDRAHHRGLKFQQEDFSSRKTNTPFLSFQTIDTTQFQFVHPTIGKLWTRKRQEQQNGTEIVRKEGNQRTSSSILEHASTKHRNITSQKFEHEQTQKTQFEKDRPRKRLENKKRWKLSFFLFLRNGECINIWK